MFKNYKIKKNIIYAGKVLHNLGLVAGFDGNISIKSGNTIFITGTMSYKGNLKNSDIVSVKIGEKLIIKGKKNPSSEFPMHKKSYEVRTDINAVIHAHPFYTVLLSVIEIRPNTNLTPEAFIFLKDIPVAPYKTPGSFELAESAKMLVNSNIVILEKHGVLAVGKDIYHALDIIEKTENIAKKTYYTLISGKYPKLFKDEEIMELNIIRNKLSGKLL
ncbi:MAG TPA: class II aldolase/adducin family protein [Spirochaetota bacterium]|nr:class II aldolase/adducin family protein [Spirochaetota bacterium]HOM37626.1 class II aldolase/adducin family protein [Spirochaetota bacterium]HPQ49403.1 class II aldolase/adducin family protein [Spirochaetota bacterium]